MTSDVRGLGKSHRISVSAAFNSPITGEILPKAEHPLCHRIKKSALRPAIIASPLSSTNSRRAHPAIPKGGRRKKPCSQVLARSAAELLTAWPPWPWTKRGDQSRFEKATRSQRYLRCRPCFERCSELLRRETPKRHANFWS